MTTEPLEAPADIAHILADLHELRQALASALGVLSQVDQRVTDIDRRTLGHTEQLGQLAELRELVTELGPVARRAAAMFGSPVGRWASSEPRPPRRERKGRRGKGGDDDRTD